MLLTLREALAASQGFPRHWFMAGDWYLTRDDMDDALKRYEDPHGCAVCMQGEGSLHMVSSVNLGEMQPLEQTGMDRQHKMVGAEIALAQSQSDPRLVESI